MIDAMTAAQAMQMKGMPVAPAQMVPQAQADRFAALMNAPAPGSGLQVPAVDTAQLSAPVAQQSGGMQVFSRLVNLQDSQFQGVMTDMARMPHNLQGMSATELAVAGCQLQVELTQVQMDMNIKMGMVQGIKNAMDTLLKNQ